MHLPTSRRRRAAALFATGAVLTTGGAAALGPLGASASSHREAPIIAGLPQYDNTDVYAFVSPDAPGMVNLIASWIPFEEPAGGPNFYPFAADANYTIKIDNDGDALEDITYRWVFNDHYRTKNTFLYNNGPVTSFNDENLNFRQTYRLVRVSHDRDTKSVVIDRGKVAPSYVGEASMPEYRNLSVEAVQPFTRRAGLSFAGQSDDPFFLDLRVFDLLYGGDLSEVGDDTLAGFNVNTVALQVPKKDLTKGMPSDNPVIGVWSTTTREDVNKTQRQVSRLGQPLVNEVVIPIKDKDQFNRSHPVNDAQFLDYVARPELPKLIEAVYGIPAPREPRDDLIEVFLTGVEGLNQPAGVTPSEQLRLNVTIPPSADPERLGVLAGDTAGFPNGRRLTDDVVDIALQVFEGELRGRNNDLGDAVNRNDVPFRHTFPYVALPTSGSDVQPHTRQSGLTPLTGGAPSGPAGPTGGLPVVPLSAMGLGLVALAGAVALAVRRPKPATA